MAWTVHHHNAMVPIILRALIREPIQRGADPPKVLALLESVIAGAVCAIARLEGRQGSEDKMLKQVMDGARDRVNDIRNQSIEI